MTFLLFLMQGNKTLSRARGPLELELEGEKILLFPEKFALWEKEKTVFLADTHFGKVAHFRKAGIGLPPQAGMDTFFRLQQIILAHRPHRIVILGDVFHSESNSDMQRFADWRAGMPSLVFDLVLGNHDRASLKELKAAGFPLYPKLKAGPFWCVHDQESIRQEGFHFFGHLHPGITLSGLGGQSVKMPCFWLRPGHLCFPAFGSFTGFISLPQGPEDVFFALTDTRVLPIGRGLWASP